MKTRIERPRCLILGCSRTKNESPEPLPAIQRYNGPQYRVLRHYLNQNPNALCALDIFVLSAKYGLIDSQTPLAIYDQLMTVEQANAFNPQVLAKLKDCLSSRSYSEIFLSMGKTYLQATNGVHSLANNNTQIIISAGASGRKLTELKNWLWGKELPSAKPQKAGLVLSNTTPETAILRGRTITLTTNEAIDRLQLGIIQESGAAHQIRNWYVDISGEKISPKWAIKHLFNIPVSEFSADEARRTLRKLGFNCYQ